MWRPWPLPSQYTTHIPRPTTPRIPCRVLACLTARRAFVWSWVYGVHNRLAPHHHQSVINAHLLRTPTPSPTQDHCPPAPIRVLSAQRGVRCLTPGCVGVGLGPSQGVVADSIYHPPFRTAKQPRHPHEYTSYPPHPQLLHSTKPTNHPHKHQPWRTKPAALTQPT